MSATTLTQTDLLRELEPVVEQNLERHLAVSKDWMPHEYVPWSDGRNFEMLGGEAWEPGQSKMSEVAKTSLVLNLLTEDNLPSYHHEIATIFGRDGAWGTWVHRWTAEEGRHGMALRDYLVVTRSVDPVALEDARMAHMGQGFQSPNHDDLLRSLAYVSFQELATRISHRNTGKLTKDPLCDQLLARIAQDENLHMLFYRNLLGAALDLAPTQTLRSIVDVVRDFEMPGNGMKDFGRKSVQIALAGIYDMRLHHDQVLAPVLRAWGVFEREGLEPEAEKAREELAELLAEIDADARRFEEKRDAHHAKLLARGQEVERVD